MRDKAALESTQWDSISFFFFFFFGYILKKKGTKQKQSMTVVTLNQVLCSNFSAFLHHSQLLSDLA